MPQVDDEPDDTHDPEGPDPEEMDYSDEGDLEVCPHCRRMIHEDTERCPHCGEYISLEDTPMTRKGWIVITIIALLMIAAVFWAL